VQATGTARTNPALRTTMVWVCKGREEWMGRKDLLDDRDRAGE